MKPWTYEENSMLNVTVNNYDLMFKISEAHLNALIAGSDNPVIAFCMKRYQPFHDIFEQLNTSWKNSGGLQKQDTMTVTQLLALTTKKLNGWQPAITTVFPIDSPGYLHLFPQGRRTFNTGSIENRIQAFSTLAEALKPTAALAAVYAEVLAHWTQLHDERSGQQQSKTNTGTGSSNVEAARINCADEMYHNLGDIMGLYYKDRSRIGGYYPLELIRQHDQVEYHRQVKPATTIFIVKHTFAAADQITLDNTGNTDLYYFLTDKKETTYKPGMGILIAPGATKTVAATALGAPGNAYLQVHNPNDLVTGQAEVHFL